MTLGVPGGSPAFWAPTNAPVATKRIANARLNASLLFKLAKKAKAVAILSEWPLAVFPEMKPAPKANGHAPDQAAHPDIRLLPEVEILRLDSRNENPHRQDDVQDRKVVALRVLKKYGLHKRLKTMHIDTSESTFLAAHPWDIEKIFKAVPTISVFTALRRLAISADNIYYPSLFPRVLLRDGNTGNEHGHRRLINFLPRSVESLEDLGIGATHATESVVLRGQDEEWCMLQSINQCNYPVPTVEGEDIFDDWVVMRRPALSTPSTCEYFIYQYVGNWHKGPEDGMEQ
ncbi:uncharacterized protein B0H64DRAFT_452767 [Chaetomium fimeti]|uniref:Uncharacterized protein n=1 Tax=Chaetomium fimeti TaxID=1854472 RepID=A0AAE0LLW2_9PEZI|nr:hypothetical protein B0H64DRAFT_452767 [Chaetomium fimeti]